MAKAKKTKNEEVVETIKLEPMGEVNIAEPEKYKDCEWCFQFDEDSPQVFAWTDDEMQPEEDPKVIFTVTNTKGSYITFANKEGKSFKIFARELSEEGRQMRTQQKELTENMINNLENESENKEA
jgi:hypothetical protein